MGLVCAIPANNPSLSSPQRHRPIYVAKIDLDNFYHQLLLPSWMCPYFSLPAISVTDLNTPSSYIVQPSQVTTASTTYPMCRTLPMGFDHAVIDTSYGAFFIDTSF